MDFLRNKEVRHQIAAVGFLTMAFGISSFLLHNQNIGWMTFVACFCMGVFSLSFTWQRYRRIRDISLDLDRLLHGDQEIRFEEYQEGELAVLQNELSKVVDRLVEQAEAMQREKEYLSDSLADISHQLRTPLTSLNILNSALLREQVEEEERFQLGKEQAVLLSRMDWLVTSLLDAGKVTLEGKRVALRDLVDDALKPLEISAELKEQTIQAKIPPDIFLFVNPEWTAEALGNIIKNCIEHTTQGGHITIAARKRPLLTEVTVTDDGPGIPDEEITHLFERFYRGGSQGKNHAGIGLALTKTIIANQSGTITAENGDTGGAKFTICFHEGTI